MRCKKEGNSANFLGRKWRELALGSSLFLRCVPSSHWSGGFDSPHLFFEKQKIKLHWRTSARINFDLHLRSLAHFSTRSPQQNALRTRRARECTSGKQRVSQRKRNVSHVPYARTNVLLRYRGAPAGALVRSILDASGAIFSDKTEATTSKAKMAAADGVYRIYAAAAHAGDAQGRAPPVMNRNTVRLLDNLRVESEKVYTPPHCRVSFSLHARDVFRLPKKITGSGSLVFPPFFGNCPLTLSNALPTRIRQAQRPVGQYEEAFSFDDMEFIGFDGVNCAEHLGCPWCVKLDAPSFFNTSQIASQKTLYRISQPKP
jgi:hypothetical protein